MSSPASFDTRFQQLGQRYLHRPLSASDGLPLAAIDAAQARLGVTLPRALRDYYRLLGGADRLNHAHNQLFAPDQLVFDGAYLLFMDENQSVVSWGIPCAQLCADDPAVWQRNNATPPTWYPEAQSFCELIASMFAWYAQLGLFD